MMNMKNGEKAAFLLAMFAIGSVIGRLSSQKRLIQKNNQPNIAQYLNRLTEFYGSKTIGYAEDEFLHLVDFGMSPQNAFTAITDTERAIND